MYSDAKTIHFVWTVFVRPFWVLGLQRPGAVAFLGSLQSLDDHDPQQQPSPGVLDVATLMISILHDLVYKT